MTENHARLDEEIVDAFDAASRFWWVFIVIGTGWLLLAIIVFRFDWKTVSAISILFGVVVIAAAIDEVFAAYVQGRDGWLRLARLVLAAALIAIGVIAFVHPGDTFAALAGVMSFYFVLKGAFDAVLAIASRRETPMWGLLLLVGTAEILIGFWAAGDFGRKSILLVVWVGVAALTRGLSAFVFAFQARELSEAWELGAASVLGESA